jgi:hypothetical protein
MLGVLAVCVAAEFVFIYGRIWFRRHREAPLRREIRTRDVTFRTVLDRVKVPDPGGRQKRAEVTAPMGCSSGETRSRSPVPLPPCGW